MNRDGSSACKYFQYNAIMHVDNIDSVYEMHHARYYVCNYDLCVLVFIFNNLH